MKIITIEPTPSPNSMKVVVDEELPFGKSFNYTKENASEAPEQIQAILAIDGVKGVYRVADFLAIERNAKYNWETILSSVRVALGEEASEVAQGEQAVDHYGEVFVHVQMFRGIPLQIKVFDSSSEHRISTGDRFVKAFENVQISKFDDNYILERKWVDFGVRYGDKEEIAQNVYSEIEATYPESRLAEIIEAANTKNTVTVEREKVTLEQFEAAEDWQKRYQLLDQMPDPEVEDLPLLQKALEDEQMSIRRLATVYLGMIEDVAVVPALSRALKDKSAAVRRTAGDCMSDLGLVEFEPAMIEALKDKNKLVRWRAAMYLYESGTENSLSALHEAENDPEFEVKLQVKMAIARIEQGEEAKGSVWKQMTETSTQNSKQ
ncbi:conserved virulence factor C family protein [Lysinibacillus endophyticus]|uniref:conserved virulence factor C family protein n=1 Tax=Ureibacillus endophyticus TaxID=1978490 RepID=UPI00209C9593|nr:conserved virulence factor C family protein [Lysinibacillus endophyticus]MCP1144409.1 conserved virulence factor C family protein [Lysinibacillus endophyticus]